MHATHVRGLAVLFALALAGGTTSAQAPKPMPRAGQTETTEIPELGILGLKMPLKEDQDPAYTIEIPRSTTRVYELEGDLFIVPPAPYAERATLVDVKLVTPFGDPENRPPRAITVHSLDKMGGTKLWMAVARPGQEAKQVRIEIVVIDDSPEAYEALAERKIKQLAPTSNVEVQIINVQTSIVKGFVESATDVPIITSLVRGLMLARAIDQANELRLSQEARAVALQVNVVNAIRTSGAHQIQLKVIIAEVNRTKMRDLGFDWSWADGANFRTSSILSNVGNLFTPAAITANADTGQLISQPAVAGIQSNLPFTVQSPNYSFGGFLRFVVESSLGKILAEPTVTVLNGQPAYFNAGGSVPILTVQSASVSGGGGGAITVQYRDFGTQITCTPSILGNGRIRLDVNPSFSERNPANDVILQGIAVPGFNIRTVETTVELESGQTLVLAGLIQSRQVANKTKMPILGDLPVIGWSFHSKSYRTEDTELLIMISPYLVDALDEGVCKLPGRESRVPNEIEWYLGSKFEPPCFPDPYRYDLRKQYKDYDIVPIPTKPYDNYGKPPAKAEPVTEMPALPAKPTPAPAAPPKAAADAAVEPTTPEVKLPDLPASSRSQRPMSFRRVDRPVQVRAESDALAPSQPVSSVRNERVESVLEAPVDMALEAANLIPAP
jgi:Flp pilus assembly secretin CpaC